MLSVFLEKTDVPSALVAAWPLILPTFFDRELISFLTFWISVWQRGFLPQAMLSPLLHSKLRLHAREWLICWLLSLTGTFVITAARVCSTILYLRFPGSNQWLNRQSGMSVNKSRTVYTPLPGNLSFRYHLSGNDLDSAIRSEIVNCGEVHAPSPWRSLCTADRIQED